MLKVFSILGTNARPMFPSEDSVFYLSFCQLFISAVFVCLIPGRNMFCLFLGLRGMICKLVSEKQIAARQGISLLFLFPCLLSHGFDPISLFQQFSDVWHHFDFLKFGQFYVHRGVCNKVLINQVPLVGYLLKLEHMILRLESRDPVKPLGHNFNLCVCVRVCKVFSI